MKKLLILLLLIPVAGLGQDPCGVILPCYPPYQPTPTFTDGFGYELRERKGYFDFTVYVDFKIPKKFDCSGFRYDYWSFFLDYDNQYIKAFYIKDHPPFTHDDAWAIRCKAAELVRHKELVERKCQHWCGGAKHVCPMFENNFCPYCGAALQPAGEKLK